MARYIYKYEVPVAGTDAQYLLDEHSEILAVGMQRNIVTGDDDVVFWAYCVDGAPTKPRTFRVIGTGWDVPEGAMHCGTVQQSWAVWHLMELE